MSPFIQKCSHFHFGALFEKETERWREKRKGGWRETQRQGDRGENNSVSAVNQHEILQNGNHTGYGSSIRCMFEYFIGELDDKTSIEITGERKCLTIYETLILCSQIFDIFTHAL